MGSREGSQSRNRRRIDRSGSPRKRQRRSEERPSDEENDENVLPVMRLRKELMALFRENRVVVCTGETGSGKTTQIPQLLLELERERQRADPSRPRLGVAVTQPRRVAAMSVARRVAEERGGRVGGEVGYTVRFDDRTSDRTAIRYMTDGVLLREFINSPTLAPYGVVMLDEAHERSIHTDVCFGLLKAALAARPDLRAVVTSATLDVARFSTYLGNCPTYAVPGRVFDVDIYHSKTKQVMTASGPAAGSRYVDDAVEVALRIHATQGPGHVLIFLTGQDEIDKACAALEQAAAAPRASQEDRDDERPAVMKVLPLYGALSGEAQAAVFAPAPRGVRKVVYCTNIAETSVTVPGVRFVVDAGYVKQKAYDPERRMEALVVVPISRVAAQQRAGRAGRTAPGQCYRLYSKECLAAMAPDAVPEIRRCNLANTVLQLKALGVSDVLKFDFLDPPDEEQSAEALRQLFFLGAIDADGKVTSLGVSMSRFPLEPSLSRALLAAAELGCLAETLTVAAAMSGEPLLRMPSSGGSGSNSGGGAAAAAAAEAAHERFRHPQGDPLTYLRVYRAWEASGFSEEWARKTWISLRALKAARAARRQLEGEVKKALPGNGVAVDRSSGSHFGGGGGGSGGSGNGGGGGDKTGGGSERRGERPGHGGSRGSSRDGSRGGCSGSGRSSGAGGGSGCSGDSDVALRQALCAGFYTNAAERCAKDGVYRALPVPGAPQPTLMQMHPSCVLSKVSPSPLLVVYAELIRTARPFMRHVMVVDRSWLDERRERLRECDIDRLCGRRRPEIEAPSAEASGGGGSSSKEGEMGVLAPKAVPAASTDALAAARARFMARKGGVKR